MPDHLFDRLLWAKANLTPVQSQYRIVWEDPSDLDAPAKITAPDPHWLAAALHGGVLPPVDAYIRDKRHLAEAGAQDFRAVGGAEHPYAEPIGPMTEEQAIEYLILKDLPESVISYTGNRTILRIVPTHTIPTDRANRNAWRINQEAA